MIKKSLLLLCLPVFTLFLPMLFSEETATYRKFADVDIINEIVEANRKLIMKSLPNFDKKIANMSKNAFSFLIDSYHLMKLDMETAGELEFLRTAPKGLVVGDLHMHNFSLIRIEGKEPTYIINDLAQMSPDVPLSFDLFRLAVSMVASFEKIITRPDLEAALNEFCNAYLARAGDPEIFYWPQIPTSPFLSDFIADGGNYPWEKFIKRTSYAQDFLENYNQLPISKKEKEVVTRLMRCYLKKESIDENAEPDLKRIVEIAQRYDKELSEVGLRRYFVLLHGDSKLAEDEQMVEVRIVYTSSIGETSRITSEWRPGAPLKKQSTPHIGHHNFPWNQRIKRTNITTRSDLSEFAAMLGFIAADFHAQSGRGLRMRDWLRKARKEFITKVFEYTQQMNKDLNLLQKTTF